MPKKIIFIYPSSYDSRQRLIKSKKSFLPFRTLPYLAALTPKRYETHIVDELVDDLNFDQGADLVALTGMLRHMPRAIEIGRQFRMRGIKTMIGGVGAFALQHELEKSEAFDCIVIGEVDEIWGNILNDFEQGTLKPLYECPKPELGGLPFARFDLLDSKKYMKSFSDRKHPITPIETSRGCPHNCRFCLVSRYFGRKMRYRPIAEVIKEVEFQGAKHVLFTDDNIAANPDRARTLFKALSNIDFRWTGQFETTVIKHPDLLELARKGGCRSAFVGIESLDISNLVSVDKGQISKIDFIDVAKAFKEAGILLIASLIFGLENDTPETIEYTIEKMHENGVEFVIPWMLTPIPRTPLHDDYKCENRLIHENFSLYDYWHPVIHPKQITAEELEKYFWSNLNRFYSLKRISSRILQGKSKLHRLLYSLYYHKQIKKQIHPFAGYS